MNDPHQHVMNLAECLRGIKAASRPETRIAEHMLMLDLNDTWRFAFQNPDAVTVTE